VLSYQEEAGQEQEGGDQQVTVIPDRELDHNLCVLSEHPRLGYWQKEAPDLLFF
jgi:hypothetical protein